MSSFTSEPLLRQLSDGKLRIEEGFTYYIGEEDSEQYVVIPNGFITDFASIPKIFHSFFSPFDYRWAKASIIHDFLYSKNGYYWGQDVFWEEQEGVKTFSVRGSKKYINYSRRFADNIFLESMGILGTPFLIRILFWIAVRLGGIFNFEK